MDGEEKSRFDHTLSHVDFAERYWVVAGEYPFTRVAKKKKKKKRSIFANLGLGSKKKKNKDEYYQPKDVKSTTTGSKSGQSAAAAALAAARREKRREEAEAAEPEDGEGNHGQRGEGEGAGAESSSSDSDADLGIGSTASRFFGRGRSKNKKKKKKSDKDDKSYFSTNSERNAAGKGDNDKNKKNKKKKKPEMYSTNSMRNELTRRGDDSDEKDSESDSDDYDGMQGFSTNSMRPPKKQLKKKKNQSSPQPKSNKQGLYSTNSPLNNNNNNKQNSNSGNTTQSGNRQKNSSGNNRNKNNNRKNNQEDDELVIKDPMTVCLRILKIVGQRIKEEEVAGEQVDQEADNWQIRGDSVSYSYSVQQWLDRLLEESEHKIGELTHVQRVYRGYLVRKQSRPVMRTWKQIRAALAHAMRAQFVRDYEEDDEHAVQDGSEEGGADELKAVKSFVSTLKMLASRRTKLFDWCSDRIMLSIEEAEQHIAAIADAKRTLREAMSSVSNANGNNNNGNNNNINNSSQSNPALATAEERLSLMTSALEKTRKLDEQVLAKVVRSNCYWFNPLVHPKTGEIMDMQSLPESGHVHHAVRTLRSITDNWDDKLDRFFRSVQTARDVRTRVAAADRIGLSNIAEVEKARALLQQEREVCDALESAIEEQDKVRLQTGIEKAGSLFMQRPVVSRAMVCLQELDVRERLQQGKSSMDVAQLSQAVQYAIEAKNEQRKERLRQHDMHGRRSSLDNFNAVPDEVNEDEERGRGYLLDVDDELEQAHRQLKKLKLQQNVRELIHSTIFEATEMLERLRDNEATRQERASHHSAVTPNRRKRWVGTDDISRMVRLIKNAIRQGEEVGLDKDLEEIKTIDLSKYKTVDLTDAKEVTELRSCLLELEQVIKAREQCREQIQGVMADAAKFAFTTGSNVQPVPITAKQLNELRLRVKDALNLARVRGIDARFVQPLRDVLAEITTCIEGRSEARASIKAVVPMVKTTFEAHPCLADFQAKISASGSVLLDGMEHEEDEDVVDVLELIKDTLHDCELVGLAKGKSISFLRRSAGSLMAYVRYRMDTRRMMKEALRDKATPIVTIRALVERVEACGLDDTANESTAKSIRRCRARIRRQSADARKKKRSNKKKSNK